MKKYSYNQSPFYKCTTKKRLYQILNSDKETINKRLKEIYNSDAYHLFQENGRNIASPNKKLKIIQKRINSLISRIEIPDWAHGGIKKRSIQTNAKVHANSNVFLMLDIKGFYDNCTRERIFQFFTSKFKMPRDVAKIMTDLTTYKNKLTTGSPTSSYLSLLVYEEMFIDINKLLNEDKLIMTLYIDDLTLSGTKEIQDVSSLLGSINKILRIYGHQLNNKKTAYKSLNDYPIITSIAISPSGEMRVGNKLRHKIITDIKELNKYPDDKSIRNTLRGRINSAQQIEKDIFMNTLLKLKDEQ